MNNNIAALKPEVECGIRNISIVNVEKLARALDVDAMEMFDFRKVSSSR